MRYGGFIWDSDMAGHLAYVSMGGMVGRGWGSAIVGGMKMIKIESVIRVK